jgi:hypothetical protein
MPSKMPPPFDPNAPMPKRPPLWLRPKPQPKQAKRTTKSAKRAIKPPAKPTRKKGF